MKTVSRRALRLCLPGLRPGATFFVRVTGVSACLVAASAVSAQAPATRLDPVVVTATRQQLPLSQVLSDVSVISREEIERRGAGSVVDVLRNSAGFQMVRNGGPGGNSSLYIRGGEQRFTAVLIDGVRIDSQATGGASWEAIPLAQIERIEILRGPASAWYGSDAMGGVVQIFTRKGEDGGVTLDAGVGVGSNHTAASDASLSGTSGPLDFSFGAATESSDGFNVTRGSTVVSVIDRDGHWRRSVNGRLGFQLADAHRVEVSALDSHVRAQYDHMGSAADDRSTRDLQTLRALWTAQWTKAWRSTLTAGQADDDYNTRPEAYDTSTRVQTYAWQNDVTWGAHGVQAILERRQDGLRNGAPGTPFAIDGGRNQDALGLGYRWRDGGRALQLQFRQDDDSEFGSHRTGSVAAGVDVAAGWRLHSSFGTGFRAPTLYQRFSEYGSPMLSPESSRNVDVSLQRSGADSHLGLTAFHNRIDDLIVFGAPGPCADSFGCYDNAPGESRLSGLTLDARKTWQGLRGSGSVDFLSAKNATTDRQLARRARRTASLRLDKDIGDWTVGGQWLLVGKRFDDAANRRTLGGYGVLNLDAQVRLNHEWRLQARLDNAFDKDYATANNFISAPRSLFVGVRWTPKV